MTKAPPPPPGRTPGHDHASLPAPGPSFPALVAMHVRLLVREFTAIHLLAAAAVVTLPLAALFLPFGLEALADDPSGIRSSRQGHAVSLVGTLLLLSAPLALIWPEVPWRSFPPGGRRGLDAFPVSRRVHRMARSVAGLIPLLAVYLASALSFVIFRHRLLGLPQLDPATPAGLAAQVLDTLPWQATSPLVGLLALLLAYLLGSVVALRWGRPLLLMAVGTAVLFAGPLLLMAFMGPGEVADQLVEIVKHPFSPLTIVLRGPFQETSALLPGAVWVGAAFLLLRREAGLHDEG